MRKFLLTCFALAFALCSFAQERKVTGRVTSSEDGQPLPGVNVVVKGTTAGTVTDADGRYTLDVPTGEQTLVFSFIGLQTQEVAASADRTSVDVSLLQDVTQLSEVIVTGQGIVREKRAVGYAVTSVSGAALQQKPETDIGRLLSGKVPGVAITNTGGTSGSGTNIIIRGYSSISGSNQPLFVIDGVPFNTNTNNQGNFTDGNQSTSSRFLDLDPNNIASIEVLKGLSATVLYGEQGRNGVIYITTKNGNAGSGNKAFEINASQSYFVNELASLPEYTETYGVGFQQNWGWFFSNWGPSFDLRETTPHPYGNFNATALSSVFDPIYEGVEIPYKPIKNHVKDFFRKGGISTTSVNLSGSREKLGYNASVSYTNEEGFLPNNDLKKLNFGLGANAVLADKLSLNSSLNFALTEVTTPPVSVGNGSGASGDGISIYSDVFYTPTTVDLNNWPYEHPVTKGSVYYRSGNDIQNPHWTVRNTKATNNSRRFFGKTSLKYDITDELNLTYRVGLDTYDETQEYIVNKGGVQNSNIINGLYRTISATNTIWDHSIIAGYNRDFNEDINLNVTVGANARLDTYEQDGLESTNQLVFGFINHSNFTEHSSNNSFTGANLQYKSEENLMAVYAQATVGYKDFFYFNVAGRNDWSSTVEKDNQRIFYPSVSASFIPTSAFDLESRNFNYLKLRVGYGTSAGFPDPYSTRSVLAQDSRGFITRDGTVITRNSISDYLGNADLKPELHREIEAGIEAKFIDNRVGIDLTLYRKVTEDLITDAPLDPATGFTSTSINIGEVENKGIELALTGTPVRTGSLQWDITANWYAYRSVVNELGPGLTEVAVAGYTDLGNYAIPGEPFNVIKGNYVERHANGQPLVNASGDYVASDEIKIIGNPNPDWTMSLINNVSYKGFNFSMQWDYRHGGDIYSTTISALYARGVTKDTDVDRSNTFVLPGVLADGTPNNIQTTASNYFFNNFGFGPSELQIYDGTTIRLREVSLGYSLPKSLLSKTPLKAVSLNITGQNLFYNAVNTPKYMNFDTDVMSTGVGNGLGLDFLTGPSSRRYGATLRVTF